jgi:hypothetical protein
MGRLLAICALLLVALPGAASAQDVDRELDCNEPVPERVVAPVGLAGATRIELRALVQLDGITQEQAAPVMAGVAGAYAPLGIDFTVGRYTPVALQSSDLTTSLEESRAPLAGKRPPWAHVVFTLTSKNLVDSGDEGVGGIARCIGGITADEDAFAIGEYVAPNEGAGILDSRPDNGFRLVAHEVGHLLGAQHHYASCAEGIADDDPAEGTPCTLMSPNGLLNGRAFGLLESAVIRAYAEDFAKPLPPVPPEEPAPEPATAPAAAKEPAATSTPARSGPTPACARAQAAERRARAALASARRSHARRRIARARTRATTARRTARTVCREA